ncbi:MAG: nucleotide exchange factor GrpE [Coriobacteriales bacterium]|nr:nucleotide exchange factor GrpE [Coriobacteriales bacterium]
MQSWEEKRNDNVDTTDEDAMKVPIDEPAVDPESKTAPELDEEAMVEAAIKAGEQAAEEELAAQADAELQRAKAERDELYERLEEATGQVDAAKQAAKDATDRLARLQADWENFRRRTRQEREVERERAAEKLVLGLLPVLDDMERAVDHARQSEEQGDQYYQFVDGVQQIHDKMVGILEKDGVEVIDPAGEPFEPLSHQAVGREENTEAYDETVAQVYQKGYRLGGKVIRSAMVTVTYGGPKRPAEED